MLLTDTCPNLASLTSLTTKTGLRHRYHMEENIRDNFLDARWISQCGHRILYTSNYNVCCC